MDRATADEEPLHAAGRGAWIAAIGAVATVVGIVAHEVCRAFPAERLLLSLVLAGLVAAAAWPLRRGLRWSAASAFAALWLVLLAVFVGPLPMLAALLLGAAAWSIGDRLVPDETPSRAPIAVVTGLMLIAMVAGWLIALPVHVRWVWLPALALPILLRHRALHAAAVGAVVDWRDAVREAPRTAAAAVMLLGLASIACWVPAMQADDLAFHLALPAMLLSEGAYRLDPEYQKWAFAPWAGDVLHAIVSVLSGRETFGALNALWIALCAALIGGPLAAVLRGTPVERWAAVALFAAFPPLVWMASGLQTELPSTAVLLAFASLALAPTTPGLVARAWLPACLLFAGLFALKLVHGVAALPLLAVALWRYRNARWSRIALPAVALAMLGASSYVQSWLHAGNPVLPVLNDLFASPYAPSAPYADPRWHAGFGVGIDLLWRLTFDTAAYVEGWDGGLGFGLVALAALWAYRALRGPQRIAVLAATAIVIVPLIPMQYARYAWPGIVLLLTLLVFGAERLLGRRPFVAMFVGLCVLNLGYQANASWIHHSAAVKRTIRSVGDPAAILPHYVPERVLLQRVPRSPGDLVLASDPERNVIAELGPLGRTVSPHDPSLAAEAAAANADPSGTRWAALLRRERIRWVLVSRPTASPALDAALAQRGAERVDALNARELWRISD